MTTSIASTTLSSGQGATLLIVVIAGALLAGLVVIVGRRVLGQGPDGAQSLVRRWLAVSLVFGLLAFCAAAFWIEDEQLRSALFGGLVATVGAATAFHFSSKGSDQARADILKTATTVAQGGAPPTTFSAASPPVATKDQAYTYVFVADRTPPLTYSIGSGGPPDGVELELDGTVHGTPGAPGTSPFSVIAKNALGSHSTAPLQFVVND